MLPEKNAFISPNVDSVASSTEVELRKRAQPLYLTPKKLPLVEHFLYGHQILGPWFLY